MLQPQKLKQGLIAFDTAYFYGNGTSDACLKPYLSDRSLFVSTKVGLVWDKNTVKHSASAQSIREQTYRTLDHLGTDHAARTFHLKNH